jgi:hypothetical protein
MPENNRGFEIVRQVAKQGVGIANILIILIILVISFIFKSYSRKSIDIKQEFFKIYC